MVIRSFNPVVFSDVEANYDFKEEGSQGSTISLDVNTIGQENAAIYASSCEQIAVGFLRILIAKTLTKFAIAGVPYTLTDVQNDVNAHIDELAVHLDLESTGALAVFGPPTPTP